MNKAAWSGEVGAEFQLLRKKLNVHIVNYYTKEFSCIACRNKGRSRNVAESPLEPSFTVSLKPAPAFRGRGKSYNGFLNSC